MATPASFPATIQFDIIGANHGALAAVTAMIDRINAMLLDHCPDGEPQIMNRDALTESMLVVDHPEGGADRVTFPAVIQFDLKRGRDSALEEVREMVDSINSMLVCQCANEDPQIMNRDSITLTSIHLGADPFAGE